MFRLKIVWDVCLIKSYHRLFSRVGWRGGSADRSLGKAKTFNKDIWKKFFLPVSRKAGKFRPPRGSCEPQRWQQSIRVPRWCGGTWCWEARGKQMLHWKTYPCHNDTRASVKQLFFNQHVRSFDSLVSLFFWEFGFWSQPVAVYISLLIFEKKKTHRRANIDLTCYIVTYEVNCKININYFSIRKHNISISSDSIRLG